MNTLVQEELSQAKVRCAIGTFATAFFGTLFYIQDISLSTKVFISLATLFSYFWYYLTNRYQGDYIWRRRIASLFDITSVCYALYLFGEWGAIVYFLFLWTIVGTGIRFGQRALIEVMILGVIGFSIVLSQSEYWLSILPTGIGLLVGLIALPLFYLTLINRLHALNEQLNTELRHATFAATHDGMTKLLNREYFFQRSQEKLIEADRYEDCLAIVFVDLDGFKEVNDTLGHHYGDELLKSISNKMQKLVRQSDLVARLGGDEFALVLDRIDRNEINTFANRLVIEIGQSLLIENHTIQVTASIGISVYPDHGKDIDTLVKAADTAMYYSKRQGKNRFTIVDDTD